MNSALELWRAAGWTMLHFLWLGAIIGMLVSATRAAVRRAPPWLRYCCALFWFGVLATTPLVIVALVLQRSELQPPATVSAQSELELPQSGLTNVGPLPHELDYQFRQEPVGRVSRQFAGIDPSTATSGATSGSPAAWQYWVATAQPLAEWLCDWLPWVWLCGSPLVLCLLLSGVVGADRLRRDAELLVAHPLGARCRRCARSLGIRRRVLIGVSERIAAPLLLGILRPMILLPPAVIGECSAEQIEMILWHELAHVRRSDNLVNLIQRLIEALLFFHPVVWRVSAWVRLEREHCCDAVVLRHVAEPLLYAETLATLAMPELSPRLATASLSNHQLVSRIRHILNLEDRAMRVSHKLALTLSVGIISGGVFTYSMAQQAIQPPAEQPTLESQSTDVSGYVAQVAGDAGPTLQVTSGAPAAGPPTAISVGSAGNGPAVGLSGAPAGVGFTVSAPAAGSGSASNGSPAPSAGAPSVSSAGGGLTAEVHFQPQTTIVRELSGQSGMMQLAQIAWKGPAWSAAQATGAPDTAQAGDHGTAWASATPDGQDEWLQVEFDEPAEAAAVLINETFNPGAVTAVQATSANGQILAVWKGADPVGRDRKKGLAIIPLSTSERVQKITILIDSKSVPGWNEIDAVGLLDLQGVTHWATRATASSAFNTEYLSTRIQLGRGLRTSYDPDSGRDRVGQLEQQMQQLQQSLDEIKSLLKAQTAPAGGAGVPRVPQPDGASRNNSNSFEPAAVERLIVPTVEPTGTDPDAGAGRADALPKPHSTGIGGVPDAGSEQVAPQALYGIPILERLFVPSVRAVPANVPASETAPVRN